MNYDNRNYLVFNFSEIDKVDFSQVLETSAETVRKSVDGTKTFVKWSTEDSPSFIDSLSWKEGPYTYEEILSILSEPEWNSPNNP